MFQKEEQEVDNGEPEIHNSGQIVEEEKKSDVVKS